MKEYLKIDSGEYEGWRFPLRGITAYRRNAAGGTTISTASGDYDLDIDIEKIDTLLSEDNVPTRDDVRTLCREAGRLSGVISRMPTSIRVHM